MSARRHVLRSAFYVRRSAFDVLRSTFDVRRSTFELHYFEPQTLNLRDHISGDRP